MEALIESIVQTGAGDRLTSAQLQALIGLASATSVPTLARTHVLFQNLSANFSQLSESEDSLLCIRLALLLCTDVAHRDVIFSIVETHSDAVESAVAPSISSLAAPQSSDPLSPVSNESQKMLSYLILLVLAAGETKLKAKDLIEFVGAGVESAVHILVVVYADVVGAVAGVAPVVSGSLQTYLSLRIVQMLHELTFWTTYEDLYSQLGIGSHRQKALSRDTADTPLHASTGPYRHHLGQVISYLVYCGFFSLAILHMSRLVWSLSVPVVESTAQLREHLLLLKTLLTQTEQFAKVLRTTVFHHGFLGSVCVPLLKALATQQLLTNAHVGLFLQCVDVTATLTCYSADGHRRWVESSTGLLEVVETVTAESAAFVAAGGERTFTELVAQLVRLVVNSHSCAPTAELLQLWKVCLDDAGKQHVAQRLSNPRSRGSPVDVFSPAYDALRPLFHIDTRGSPVAATQGAPLRNAGPQPGHRALSHGRGRRGRSRSRGRGRSRSRGGRHPRRCRPSRHQRIRRRFRILAQRPAQNVELDTATLELLEAVGADGESSSSSSSSDDEAEPAEAAVATPDLSRWRRGPPPRSIPAQYICALSHSVIQSTPVLSSTGYVFDEDVIMDYLKSYQVCPVSGAPLTSSDLVVDPQLKEELNRVRTNFF